MILNKEKQTWIVIPENATLREKFASNELKKYLEMIFEIEIQISSDLTLPAGNVFLIGGPERNKLTKEFISETDFDQKVPGPEGIFIKSVTENIIVLAGSSKNKGEFERGTVYAVYEFLEKFLDCNFAGFSTPAADVGEIVPKKESAELNELFYIKPMADRTYRTAIVQYSNWAGNPDRELNIPFFDWLVKNRYNRILTWSSIYEFYKANGLIEEAEKRGIRFTVGHHESSELFLPARGNKYFSEKYYETHPEYYKLLENGERFLNTNPDGQWVFCSRNENAVKQVSENIIKWLDLNPAVDIVSLWPNDGDSEQCVCEECKKYDKTENYAYFVSNVAKAVREKRPEIMFDILIYGDLWKCPDNIKLDEGVIIDQSTALSMGSREVGKPDGSCLNGTHFEENLLKWKSTDARVVYYEYYMGLYGMCQRLLPMADEIQSIWKNFIEKGIDGSGTQIECFNMWNHLLNFYTFGRTGYDVNLSFEENVRNFSGIFGNGAQYISEIIFMLENCIDGQPERFKYGHYLMNHIDKEKAYELYEKALNSAENNRFRNNIRMMRMAFRYTDIETQEELSKTKEAHKIEDKYDDFTGELAYMSKFDSYWKNNPGYGIMIPVDSKKSGFVPDYWYDFE